MYSDAQFVLTWQFKCHASHSFNFPQFNSRTLKGLDLCSKVPFCIFFNAQICKTIEISNAVIITLSAKSRASSLRSCSFNILELVIMVISWLNIVLCFFVSFVPSTSTLGKASSHPTNCVNSCTPEQQIMTVQNYGSQVSSCTWKSIYIYTTRKWQRVIKAGSGNKIPKIEYAYIWRSTVDQ